MSSPGRSRRRFLVSIAVVVGVAGCSGAPSDESGAGERSDGTPSPATPSASTTATERAPVGSEDAATTAASVSETASSTADGTAATGTDGLDLREANVVDVEVRPSGDSSRFSVTLYHDDDGEDGYADWWQVETLHGEQLGRRTLLHAHSTAPFTRSETVSIPEGTEYVVVRGHDQTHGYGGQAMVVTLDTGATEPVRQGPEPRSFADDEPRG